MQAGRLRHRVTIEQVTETPNEFGEPTETWAEFASAWADREDLTGRELFAAQQVSATVTTRFTMRYVTGVTAKMRLLSDGIVYDIDYPADQEGRGRTLIILATRAN